MRMPPRDDAFFIIQGMVQDFAQAIFGRFHALTGLFFNAHGVMLYFVLRTLRPSAEIQVPTNAGNNCPQTANAAV